MNTKDCWSLQKTNMKYTHFSDEIQRGSREDHDAFGTFFSFVLSIVLIGILTLVAVNVFHFNSLINSL